MKIGLQESLQSIDYLQLQALDPVIFLLLGVSLLMVTKICLLQFFSV